MGRAWIQVVMKWCILFLERKGERGKEKWRWGNLAWPCALAIRLRMDFFALSRVDCFSIVGRLWYAWGSCGVVR